nr:hypothetical protein GCM10020063_040860 [Dactylosporangium thailandense]
MQPTQRPSPDDAWGADYDDVPEMLESAASASAEEARAAWERILKCLFRVTPRFPAPDRLAPVIAAAVPHFVALACSAPHERATALSAAGRAADPERPLRASPEAGSALRAQAATIAPLLDDPDAAVRVSAVYALTHAGVDPSLLRRRLAVETELGVRAALLLGLGAEAVDTLAAAQAEDPTVVVAAALAGARAGVPWPDGALPVVAAALAADAEVPADWLRCRSSTLADLLCTVDGEVGRMLLDALPLTVHLLRAVEDCARWHRPARAWLASWAGRLLLDADPRLRAAAIDAIAATGAAAVPWADGLAQAAASAETPPDARQKAIRVLGELGDPRWVPFGGWNDNWWLDLTPAQFDAFRVELERATAAGEARVVAMLAHRVRPMGARASALTSQLRAARGLAPKEIAWALEGLDAADPVDLPALQELAAEGFAEPAFAYWRRTHDRSVVVEAIQAARAAPRWREITRGLTMAADVGLELPELLPTLWEWQQQNWDLPPMVHEAQLAAARFLAVMTGDGRHPPSEVLANVRAILHFGEAPASQAAALIAELGWTELVDDLSISFGRRGHWGKAAIAEALWRLGRPAPDLVPVLLDTIEDGVWPFEAVSALVTIGATTAVPRLTQLAEQDRAMRIDFDWPEMAWRDERLRADLRAAAATLAGR